MNARELLRSLQEEGIQLWREGEELRYRAPIRLRSVSTSRVKKCSALGVPAASSWWPRKNYDAIRKFRGDLWWKEQCGECSCLR